MALLLLSLLTPGCSRQQAATASKSRPSYAFITNGVTNFWDIAAAGAQSAGNELGVDVTVVMPSSMTDQTRKMEDLLTRGTDGVAISPIDSANQGDVINKVAAQTNLITQDSDAPQTDRLVYIGMDNYVAGTMCGKTLRDALPDGGKIMVFIGRLDQDNAKRRRQGCIDGFLGRQPDARRNDPAGDVLTSDDGKFTVLGTMTDQFDRAKAKANVEDAVTRYSEITAMVGLFDYNPQIILEALERTGKLGQIKVMAFDENPVMLQGIKDGTVIGTVVQNPYRYGSESIRMLDELHKGNRTRIPADRFINIPARVINAANVDEFRKETEARLAIVKK
ncbi:MAG TPA: substrate-binding domain-containing protein [Lacipirellulaceae bacterium]|nr:substrate-binding domain-containing protein [Lacipirellulaceae bacterium]